jgi:hypothetical protein
MPAKEIKELRQSGKLEEALALAKSELEADPGNIWPKRNIAWVYYDFLKLNNSPDKFDQLLIWVNEINALELPAGENMLSEQLCWQIGKMAFALSKENQPTPDKALILFEAVKNFHFNKPSEGYSFLFKALHKSLKETDRYLEFADWWNFENFMSGDFQKEIMPNGKTMMAIAEQGYIAYSKHLLPKQTQSGETLFDREKAEAFLPVLSGIAEDYPEFQYPAYFNAKLLLALGDKDNMLEKLLPFARKKRNDFWVWELLAEAFTNDPDRVFACYCKALSCKSPEEMLVSLRQKMAKILVGRELYNEAKTEIEQVRRTRKEYDFHIPGEVVYWVTRDWYKSAVASKSNLDFYRQYTSAAEEILFQDVAEEPVVIDFVNSDKKIANFIASEKKFGFFKYDRFLSDLKAGEMLKVRFQGGSPAGMYQLLTAVKAYDEELAKEFIRQVSGNIKIQGGKPFGFIGEAFVHPSLVKRYKLTDGADCSGRAVRSFNPDKKQWGWKLI